MFFSLRKTRLLKVLSLTMALLLLTGCSESNKNSATDSTSKNTVAPTHTVSASEEETQKPMQTETIPNTETQEPTDTVENTTTATTVSTQTSTPTKTPSPTKTPDSTPEQDTPKTAKIIILAGQSNAVGATLKTPLKDTVGTARNRTFTKGYSNIKIAYFAEAGGANGAAGTFRTNIDYTKGKTQPLKDVFVKASLMNSWTTQMFGPEIGIAEYLNEQYPGEEFFIVKVAKGGVSVSPSWEKGGYCYKKLTETMEICCTSLEAAGYTPKLFSICWIQGENEGASKTLSQKYADIVSGVATRMRSDFGKYAAEDGIAFIDAGISDSPMWKYYKEVNEGKKQFSETSDLNYYFSVIEAGLEYKNEPAGNPDLAHYDSASVVKLGNILGEYIDTAYKNLRK